MVTGDFQEEVIIFCDRQTDRQTLHHNIYIVIVIFVIVNIIFFIVNIILLRYNLDNSIHDVQIPGKRRLP